MKSGVEAAALSPDAHGWAELDVPIEEIGWATREMIRIGPEIEVLDPPELRHRLKAAAQALAALYAD